MTDEVCDRFFSSQFGSVYYVARAIYAVEFSALHNVYYCQFVLILCLV